MRKLRNISVAIAILCFILAALTYFLGWNAASPLVPHPLVFAAIGALLLVKVFFLGLMKLDAPAAPNEAE